MLSLHPAQRRDLIELAGVRRSRSESRALGRGPVAEAERAEPVVDRHDDDVAALARAGRRRRSARPPEPERERAAVDPEQHRPARARRAQACTRSGTGSLRSAARAPRCVASRRSEPAGPTARSRAPRARPSTARAARARGSAARRPAASQTGCRGTRGARRAVRPRSRPHLRLYSCHRASSVRYPARKRHDFLARMLRRDQRRRAVLHQRARQRDVHLEGVAAVPGEAGVRQPSIGAVGLPQDLRDGCADGTAQVLRHDDVGQLDRHALMHVLHGAPPCLKVSRSSFLRSIARLGKRR